MTDDELRRLAEAASPGPWKVGEQEPPPAEEIVSFWSPAARHYIGDVTTGMADAAYIVAACNAVPALLDRAQRAEAALRRYGAHDPECHAWGGRPLPCRCCFADVLAALGEQP